jgi:hypothetical protein
MRGLATTIVACGLMTACTPGPPADGRWDPPQLVAMVDDGEDARVHQVVVDAHGNATAVWSQTDGTLRNLWANRLVPGAGWGTPTRIETTDIGPFGAASVAADPTGNVIAVWSQYDASGYGIGANRFVPGVGWGTPQLLREAGDDSAGHPRVAMDAAGNAIAIWSEFSATGTTWIWSIRSSRFVPAAGWSGAQWIGGHQWGASNPQIAMTPSGLAIAVWSEGTPFSAEFPEAIGPETISFRRYVPGSGWDSGGNPTEGGTQWGSGAQFPQVATDPDGNFIIVWEQDGVMVRRFAVGRGWDMPFNLEGAWPQVVVDPAGTGTVISSGGAATFTPDSGWVESPPIAPGAFPSLAVGPPGELFAVWTESGIRSNRPFGGSTPAAIDSSPDAVGGHVAVDPHGNATAVWQRPGGIWSSTFHPDAWGRLRDDP